VRVICKPSVYRFKLTWFGRCEKETSNTFCRVLERESNLLTEPYVLLNGWRSREWNRLRDEQSQNQSIKKSSSGITKTVSSYSDRAGTHNSFLLLERDSETRELIWPKRASRPEQQSSGSRYSHHCLWCFGQEIRLQRWIFFLSCSMYESRNIIQAKMKYLVKALSAPKSLWQALSVYTNSDLST
jgi:hypothetical protein